MAKKTQIIATPATPPRAPIDTRAIYRGNILTVLIAIISLAACQSARQPATVPPPCAQPPAMMVFDTVVLNPQNQPEGWYAAISLLAVHDKVTAEISQRRAMFFVSYPDAAQLAAAAESLHHWDLEQQKRKLPRPTYEYHRIQYSFTIAGKSISGLALYSDPSDLPPTVQSIRRAAIDQCILHELAGANVPVTNH